MCAYIGRMRINTGFGSKEVFKQVNLCLSDGSIFLYVLIKDITHFHSNRMLHQVNHE